MFAGPHWANVFVQLCKWSKEDMEIQVDMHRCTDTFTHSNQGVGLEDHQD